VSIVPSSGRARVTVAQQRWLVPVAVAALALVAGVSSVVLSTMVFPFPTGNPDEAVYLLQADTLRHGRLFPPAPTEHREAFQPFFTRYRDGEYVPKYSPVHAALLALAGSVFGTYRAGPALIAGALVVTTYLLALEVLHRRRQALFAAVLLAASPLFVVQSATFLSYLSALLLLELFAIALLRAVRLQSVRWHVVAGFVFGVAFFARSYDALLFAIPFGVLFVATHRHTARAAIKHAAALVVGVAPVLLAYGAFNWAATGHPLHPPFAIDPTDTIGFGPHRFVPGDPYLDYTPREGLVALTRYLTTTSFWVFGGIPIVGLAIVALTRKSGGAGGRALAGVILAIPVGYFFFYGISVSSVLSRGVLYLGPWYYTALFGPLLILGAAGFSLLWRREPLMASAAVIVMAALSSFVTVRALRANADRATSDRRLHHALEVVPAQSLVFLPADVLLTPFPTARNPTLDGEVLYALDRGPSANVAVAQSFPDRRPYLVQFPPARGRPQQPSRLRPLDVVSGRAVNIPINVGQAVKDVVLSVEWRGERVDCRFDPAARNWSVRLRAGGATCPVSTTSIDGQSDLPPEYLFVTITRTTDGRAVYRWVARADTKNRAVFLTPPLAPERNELDGGRGVGSPTT
jgi:4-amino-4-deoxy-L-arabinose transferase-like glycosyltransferase